MSEDIFKIRPFKCIIEIYCICTERYGRIMGVFMPYSEALHSLSDWYVQLLPNLLENGVMLVYHMAVRQ